MDAKAQTSYDRWKDARSGQVLPEGKRWLTPDDVWQKGDEYNGNGEPWWVIGGPHTSITPGTHVSLGWLCYTPRGSTKREYR